MAFDPRHFVICSKFPLFKANCNLWLYTTSDSLEDCLAENYFQPRMNTKNQDSPEVGDIIQCIVGTGTLAYLSITAKTEKPYNITVEKTYLENEAEIYDAIYTAADKGEQLYQTGVWYAKMYSDTVVPTGSEYEDRNYADFSQVDSDNNPIIVIYECQSGVWTEIQRITPPTEYNGYLPITSKFWDIEEQTGQQGGEVLWSYNTKRFTPFPRIISYDSIHVTGDSTVVIPDNPSSTQIVNKDYVDSAIAAIPTPTVDIVQSVDAEIVGTLTINNSAVSGFSDTNYLTIPGILDLNQDFEIGFSFTTPNTLGTLQRNLFALVDSATAFSIIAWDGDYLHLYINGTLSTGHGALSTNTKYWVKATRVGNDYTLYLSTDGTTYTSVSTITTADTLLIGKYAFKLWTAAVPGVSTGTLYMEDAYILLNGIRVWQGMDAPGLHQRVPTGHEVIEFQPPTTANNYIWCRKYADGWVEMGGKVSEIANNSDVVVTLPVEMANNSYTVTMSQYSSNIPDAFYYNQGAILNRTTTTITLTNRRLVGTGTHTIDIMWEVKGMSAQS